jgi:hypothetical protein
VLYFSRQHENLQELLQTQEPRDGEQLVTALFTRAQAACDAYLDGRHPDRLDFFRNLCDLAMLLRIWPTHQSLAASTFKNEVVLTWRRAALDLNTLKSNPDMFKAALASLRYKTEELHAQVITVGTLLLNKQRKVMVAILSLQVAEPAASKKLHFITTELLELQTLENNWTQCFAGEPAGLAETWIDASRRQQERKFWIEVHQSTQPAIDCADWDDQAFDKSVQGLAKTLVTSLETQAGRGQVSGDILQSFLNQAHEQLAPLQLFEVTASLEKLQTRTKECHALAKSDWIFFEQFSFHSNALEPDFVRRLDEVLALFAMARECPSARLAALTLKLQKYKSVDVYQQTWGSMLLYNLHYLNATCPPLADAAGAKLQRLCDRLNLLATVDRRLLDWFQRLDWMPGLDIKIQSWNKIWSRAFIQLEQYIPCAQEREDMERVVTRTLTSKHQELDLYLTRQLQCLVLSSDQAAAARKLADYLCIMFALWKYLPSSQVIGNAAMSSVFDLLKKFALRCPGLEEELARRDHLGGMVINDMPHFREYRAAQLAEAMVKETPQETLTRMNECNILSAEQIRRLLSAYERFTHVYEEAVIKNKISETAGEARQLIHAADGRRTMQKFPELVGLICAEWTMLTSLHFKKKRMQRPHNAQVLAVFRLLGLDQSAEYLDQHDKEESEEESKNKMDESTDEKAIFGAPDIPSRIQKHMVQINTGEGKSLVLAVVASVFALCGNEVDCACYSSYLSRRDAHAFERLFIGLGIHKKITYETVKSLCNTILENYMNVREAAQYVLGVDHKLAKRGGFCASPNRPSKRVLLVDEVDVFCGRDFFGRCFYPCFTIENDTATLLMDEIWSAHKKDMLQSAEKRAQFAATSLSVKKLKNQFPPGFIDATLDLAFRCLDDPELPENYAIVEGRIAYPDIDGAYSVVSMHQYKTLWTYCKERDVGRLRDVRSYLLVPCGSLNYAEIPSYSYDWIGGATGTLVMTGLEQDILAKYGVNTTTIMPSIFRAKRNVFDALENVHTMPSEQEWRLAILRQISRAAQHPNGPRPVLVYFENELALTAFLEHPDCAAIRADPCLIVLRTGSQLGDQVELNPQTKLLAPRTFGRGVDFVCGCAAVEDRGGAHVVQTFVSSAAEQTQIMGRTARYGKSGSYELIVWGDVFVPPVDGSNAYSLIEKLRAADDELDLSTRKQAIAEAAEQHAATVKFLETCRLYKRHEAKTEKTAREEAFNFLIQEVKSFC